MPEVCESGIINASADAVWAVLRDFSGTRAWAPNMASSAIEDGQAGDQVGAVRRLVFESGAQILERLIALSDVDRYFRYAMLTDEGLPIRDYTGRVRVIPITDNSQAVVEWSGTFTVREGDTKEVSEWVRDIYRSGIAGMRDHIAPR